MTYQVGANPDAAPAPVRAATPGHAVPPERTVVAMDRPAARTRPQALIIYASLEGIAALVVLIALTLSGPIRSSISIDAPGLPGQLGPMAGALFWICFGLLGSLRAGARPGGSVLTFSTPFVVAGTYLGGPLVGAFMGLISEFELRELKLPWYGIVSNHANVILSASAAGLIGLGFQDLFGPLASSSALLALVTVILMTFVFTALNAALVVPILAFRTGVAFTEASRSYNMAVRRTAVAETILAWLMATTFVSVGWWVPIICIALVVIVWRVEAQQDALMRDSRTGLLNDLGFLPIADAALRAARAGRRPSVLIFFDLDNLSAVNNGYGMEAGDEVIAAVAHRAESAVRVSDTVARRNQAGDEFLVLLDDVGTEDLAVLLANRLHDRVIEPVTLRGTQVTVTVGASLGICLLASDPVDSLKEAMELAQHRSHIAKTRVHGPAEGDEKQLSGGVGSLEQMDGTMAAFSHHR